MKTIWEGIYSEFPSLKESYAFDESRWIVQQEREANRIREDQSMTCTGGGVIREVLAGYYSIRPETFRLMDFGGGFALEFLRIKAAGLPVGGSSFVVIETEAVCKAGSDYFGATEEVSFMSGLPESPYPIDIFHSASSIHYVDDWKSFFRQVATFEPSMIVLGGVTAGKIPTFATTQDYYGKTLPVWFWNEDEFVSLIVSLGYSLVMQTPAEARYFGELRDLPMENFPEQYRLQRKCDLVFRRL